MDKLLERLQISNTLKDKFKDSFFKVSVNKAKKEIKVILEKETPLDIDCYLKLEEALKKELALDSYKLVLSVRFKENKDDYFEKWCDYLFLKYQSLSCGINYRDSLKEEDGLYLIEVPNVITENQVKKALSKINSALSNLGFKEKITTKIVRDTKILEELNSSTDPELVSKLLEIDKKKEKKDNQYIDRIKGKVVTLHSLIAAQKRAVVEGEIFFYEERKITSGGFIHMLKIYDGTDSLSLKMFSKEKDDHDLIRKDLKIGNFLRFQGDLLPDKYENNELVLTFKKYEVLDKKEKQIIEDPEPRVELHIHTKMSQMDGLVDVPLLFDKALALGYPGLAITDHNGCQSFPEVFNLAKKINQKRGKPFRVLYGVELTLVDDNLIVAQNVTNKSLLNDEFVVFDTETTGLSPMNGDSIIEIGAVKIKDGKVKEEYDELLSPLKELPARITSITGITKEMLEGKRSEEEGVRAFKEWVGDLPLVAHNAKFDISFLESAYHKYNLGEVNNSIIDTLQISRILDSDKKRHSLSAITKRYDVVFDEESHHRANYDAKGTALVFYKMCQKLAGLDILTISDLNKLVDPDSIYKYGRSYHVNLIAKNKEGLKSLFKFVSLGNTKYLYNNEARVLKSELEKDRKNLLVGSGCYLSEIFIESRSVTFNALQDLITFYDYVEIQPLSTYRHLIDRGEFSNEEELITNLEKIINLTKETKTLIVATGDVHTLDKEDYIYRDIMINQNIPGGGLHPLNKKDISHIPNTYFRTTDEMRREFYYLDDSLQDLLILENPKKIMDMCEDVEVIEDTGGVPYAPRMKDSEKEIKDLVYRRAHSLYGDPLDPLIEKRLERELKGIIDGHYDVIYLIAQRLVKKSNEDGYLVGSRGSVGSSFVATMLDITEVNPLPAHYRCPKCLKTIFKDDEGNMLGDKYASGFDLPEKKCSCGEKMESDGQDIPFETFLGFNADKVPDIDLNFSGDYQPTIHNYTKVLFGEDKVYRAGTIGTVASKTAYGFVLGYLRKHPELNWRSAEIERIASHIEGAKRTTGQHPGGIIVIPDYKEVLDFTPYQYPANLEGAWYTTHFDYHAIEECVLKLDLLGHDNPTMFKMLNELSGIDIGKLSANDPKVLSILRSTKALGVKDSDIDCPTGTLGIPELGTKLAINMLQDTNPTTFGELIKISGLSHGTGVWSGNSQDLVKSGKVPFKDVIGCRDDIMVTLLKYKLKPLDAFKIMEFVRKGKAKKDPTKWLEYKKIMEEHEVPEWFIESCHKIEYMFPKAHATAYVTSAMRIAWFKVYKPAYFYATYFSVKKGPLEIKTMTEGYEAIFKRIEELQAGGKLKGTEQDLLDNLLIAREASARGLKFLSPSLRESDAEKFKIIDDNKLLMPFITIDALGSKIAQTIVEERKNKFFVSIEDLQKRGKVSSTVVETMKGLDMLKEMPESNQLSLF